MFKLETPEERAVRITSVIQATLGFCLLPSYAEEQSYWDSIFCTLWTILRNLAGIGSTRCSWNTASSSGATSNLSLLVHGKEVVYGIENPGLGTNAEEQVRKKLKGFLDPKCFLDMSHMICYATEDFTLRVLAVTEGQSVPLLPDMFIRNKEGLLRSIMLSINFLRIVMTWEPGFANTPAREEKLDNFTSPGTGMVVRVQIEYKENCEGV